MATNQGAVGAGVIFTIASGTNSTAIGNVNSISFPSAKVDAIDITSSDGGTSAPSVRSFLAGFLDPGEISLDLTYDKTNAAIVFANVGGSNKLCTINLPATSDGAGGTGATAAYAVYGFINGYGGAIPENDKIAQTVSVKCSGAATFT